jgi:hypothetical protein
VLQGSICCIVHLRHGALSPCFLPDLRPSRLPQNPIKLNMWRLLTEYTMGKACIAECLEFDSKLPVKVILIPRPGRGKPAGALRAPL